MMFMNSQQTIVLPDFGIISLDYFVKSYINYLSVFYCNKIDSNDKKLQQMITNLDKYINELVNKEE